MRPRREYAQEASTEVGHARVFQLKSTYKPRMEASAFHRIVQIFDKFIGFVSTISFGTFLSPSQHVPDGDYRKIRFSFVPSQLCGGYFQIKLLAHKLTPGRH